jgi:hypothetical protein
MQRIDGIVLPVYRSLVFFSVARLAFRTIVLFVECRNDVIFAAGLSVRYAR